PKSEAPPPVAASVAPPPVPPRTLTRSPVVRGAVAALALGVAAYACANLAFQHNKRWVAPTVLSKSDPRVLSIAAALEQETSRKSTLVLRKKEVETRLRDTTRWIDLETSFQASFMAAVRADLDGQRAELRRLEKLVADNAKSPEPDANAE